MFRAPAGKSAAQRERLGESLVVELPNGRGRERAGLAVDDDGFFLEAFEAVARGQDLVGRELAGAVHMTQRELLGLADVEHESALVHEPDQVLRGDRREGRRTDA